MCNIKFPVRISLQLSNHSNCELVFFFIISLLFFTDMARGSTTSTSDRELSLRSIRNSKVLEEKRKIADPNFS